jgi:hypothetical protein
VSDESIRSGYEYEEPIERDFTVLEKGEYPFEVGEIFEFETSKKGNDMLPLELIVGEAGNTTKITEHLVFTKSAKWKIDGFLKSIHGGAIKPGTKIDFDNLGWLQRRRGVCSVDVEEYTRTKGTKAGDKAKRNIITGYVYPQSELEGRTYSAPAGAGSAPPEEDEEDDVPF